MPPTQQDRHRDGITIEDRWANRGRSGKRWLARVRDTRLHRYKSKAFADHPAAKAWALQTRARFELSESSAGTWPLDEVIKEYAQEMRGEQRDEAYVRTMERHGRLLQRAGVRDLGEEGLHAKVRIYLRLPTDEKHRRQESAAPAVSTQRLRFTYARMLVSYAMRYQGMKRDPLATFVMPGQAHSGAASRPSDQEAYTLEEVRRVLALNRTEDPVWLAFVVAVFTGLRAFELHALRWEELDWHAQTLRVARGKGSKIRHVPLQPELHDFLRRLGGPDAERPRIGPMFPVSKIRLDISHIRSLLNLAGVEWDRGTNNATGLPRRLAWHACRRTCAAASLAAGVDSLEIQRSLGHEEMEMTGEYAGAFARWKAVIATECWPRGRLCLFGPPNNAKAQGSVPK